MKKKARQAALLELIRSNHVSSQAALAAALAERGYSVTQASVSRDLDELGIIKTGGRYVKARPPLEADLGTITFASAGPNLIVGRCSSGLASAITVRIDAAGIDGIVGTIAGDDTIFVAVADAEKHGSVSSALTEVFG